MLTCVSITLRLLDKEGDKLIVLHVHVKGVFCHTTTKGPKWHSSFESLPTIPFTYKA